MLRLTSDLQKGDTIVEVLFAIAIFSLVAVGCLSIMNQGSQAAERALEITLVRQEVDNQAQTLRYLNDAYVAAYQSGGNATTYPANTAAGQWYLIEQSIINHPVGTAQSFAAVDGACPAIAAQGFVVDSRNVIFKDPYTGFKPVAATTYSQLVYTGSNALTAAQGIWIEGVRSATDPANPRRGYIDFHINACWNGPGNSAPLTIGTIVRLYVPRG